MILNRYLVEIMLSLDHDGNGEVDFDEFLNLMTNTDVFLEVLNTDNNDDTEAKREARKRGKGRSYYVFKHLFSGIIRRIDGIPKETGIKRSK